MPTHRGAHDHITPHGGGAGLVLVVTLSGFLLFQENQVLQIVLGMAFLLSLVGLIDDMYQIFAKIRLISQVSVLSILLWYMGVLPNVGFIEGSRLMPFLLFAGVWWINLFNFLDGIDGLASVQTICMLMLSSGLILYQDESLYNHGYISFMGLVIAATIGFLWINWPPAKSFMGDVSSLWLGYIVFSLTLLSVQSGWLSYPIWLIVGAIFITDATLTLLRRFYLGECWYVPHTSHAYQCISRYICSHLTYLRDKSIRRSKAHSCVIGGVICIHVFWLAPLSFCAMLWPCVAWWIVLFAYVPIVILVIFSIQSDTHGI